MRLRTWIPALILAVVVVGVLVGCGGGSGY